jgi:hypothetical protein
VSSEPPGYWAPEPVIRPPWLQDSTSELPRDVIDTRTKRVGRGAVQRNPDEPVFFPGRPPKHATTDWLLMLADGQRVGVEGAVVLGRNPDAVAGYPDATLIKLEDPGKTVSKTHAVMIPHGEHLYVIDLESTNGVAVVAGGVRRQVASTEFLLAPDGSVVELGSYLMGVERSEG